MSSITLARAPEELRHVYGMSRKPDDTRKLDTAGARYPREGDAPDVYATFTKSLWDEQDGMLDSLHQTWIQNLLFLAGRQWYVRSTRENQWAPKPGPRWRKWPVSNLCLPYYKHYTAKLLKQRPAWTAIPSSTDPSDIHAARLGEQVLEAKWREIRMGKVLRQAVAWLATTGNAWLLPFWDDTAGDVEPMTIEVEAQVYDEEGNVVGVELVEVPLDEEGQPRMIEGPGGEEVYDVDADPVWRGQGDVACRSISPFHVRSDPSAKTDEEMRWFVVAEVRPVSELRWLYPDKADRITADDPGILESYESFVAGVAAGSDAAIAASSLDETDGQDKAVVYHYHEMHSDEFPRGRYWQTTGTCVLSPPSDLPDGIWPCIVHMREYEVPGRFHGGCTMTHVVSLNREYNELNQAIIEHHNLMLRGKWLVPRGSMISRNSISTMPGEVIQHTPGLAPRQADLKPLPSAVYQERERVKNDFQLVSGINRISMGQPPQGVTAGRAFLVLQEADDSDFGPLTEMLEESVADLAWMMLKIIQGRYQEERLIHIVGDDRRYKAKAFRGADLAGIMDVVPQTGSSFPWSQVARQDMLMQLLREAPGLFEDEETGGLDRHRISRLLPIAGLESVYASEDSDVNEALREEDMIEEWVEGGPIPEPQPWQNHKVHMRSHERVIKSAEFQAWPAERQEIMLMHWMATRAAIEEAMARQALIAQGIDPAMVEAGGPPPGGGPVEEASGDDPAMADIRAKERELDQTADAIQQGRMR